MTIGVDIRFLAEGKRTGVEEYALNLLPLLFQHTPHHAYKLFANQFRLSAARLNELGAYPNVTIYRFRYPNKLLNLSFKFRRRPKIDELLGGCDVFFYPNIIFGATSAACPVVTTFHDLSFEYHPQFLSVKKKIWHWLVNPRTCARRSSLIVAVSESTKADLVTRYRIPPGQIRVVPSGIGLPPGDLAARASALRQKYHLPERFILFFGTLEPRKNAEGAIAAFELARRRGKIKHELVIAGSAGWLENQALKLIRTSALRPFMHRIGFVEQSEKLALFALADLLVFPSFYEGFGFPPLEAMSVGTPVITTTQSSLPEVVGGAALLVNPYDIAEIATAIERVLGEKILRAELIRRGWQRVLKFPWSQAAQATLGVLEEAAQGKNQGL